MHTRIPFDLYTADGVAAYRRFMERAADLVAEFGGSFSGEHGDGQSRGELLPRMFGEDLVAAFGRLKALFDPLNRMNPGKVVAPYGLDENLRLGGDWAPRDRRDVHFRFPHDGGSFAEAANRCVGVGRCRQLTPEGGAVMCPSYQVTREEEHSTRGRARLLFEMLDGHGDSAIRDGSAVLRSDVAELFPGDRDVRRLREQTVTLAELLTEHSPGYTPPRVPERSARALAQVHCHQHAVLGWDADGELLRRAGVDAERLEAGCCGLAGNFGFERGHLAVSEACAEQALLPRLRAEAPETVVLADGFSCRTQIHELDSGGPRGRAPRGTAGLRAARRPGQRVRRRAGRPPR
ncbi:hypothetical protein DF19_42805, partial [Streptomyces olindensis]